MSVPLLVIATATTSATVVLDCIELEGEKDVVHLVAERVVSPVPCRSVDATVTREDGALVIRLDDGTMRRASTPDVAGAILESLAEVSMVEDLIAGPPADPAPAAPGGPRALRTEPPAVETAPQGVYGGAIRAEASVDELSSFGTGVFLRGDRRFGSIVGWLGTRLVVTPGVVEGGASGGRRTTGDLLVGADWSWRFGSFVVAPGAGAGLTIVRTTRESVDCSLQRCPSTAALVPDDLTSIAIGLRLQAGLRAGWAVSESLAIEMSGSAFYDPFASDGRIPAYATDLPLDLQAALALPPEPHVGGRVGLGVRWGVW